VANRVEAHAEVRCVLFEQQVGLLLDSLGQFVATELAARGRARLATPMLATLLNPEKNRAQVNLEATGRFGFAASSCHKTQDPFAQIIAVGHVHTSSVHQPLV
jgi:hypothetical protein